MKDKSIDVSTIEVPQALYPRASQPTEKDVEHLRGQSEVWPVIIVATLSESPDPAQPDLLESTGRTVLVDGAHRLMAAKLDGVTTIRSANLGELTAEQVLSEAIARNATHGKQLSMRDKQRLAKHYASLAWKPAQIQNLLAVGARTVSRWVEEEKKAAAVKAWKKAEKLMEKGVSVSAAAKEVGVPRSTLTGWKKNPPKPAEKPEPSPKQDNLPDPEIAEKAIGEDRVDAIVESIVGFAQDAANELDAQCEGGDYSPHWSELCEAAITKIRKAYPKEWRQ